MPPIAIGLKYSILLKHFGENTVSVHAVWDSSPMSDWLLDFANSLRDAPVLLALGRQKSKKLS
jgi:hypothetical protein